MDCFGKVGTFQAGKKIALLFVLTCEVNEGMDVLNEEIVEFLGL